MTTATLTITVRGTREDIETLLRVAGKTERVHITTADMTDKLEIETATE